MNVIEMGEWAGRSMVALGVTLGAYGYGRHRGAAGRDAELDEMDERCAAQLDAMREQYEVAMAAVPVAFRAPVDELEMTGSLPAMRGLSRPAAPDWLGRDPWDSIDVPAPVNRYRVAQRFSEGAARGDAEYERRRQLPRERFSGSLLELAPGVVPDPVAPAAPTLLELAGAAERLTAATPAGPAKPVGRQRRRGRKGGRR